MFILLMDVDLLPKNARDFPVSSAQVASGRFGVTAAYLRSGLALYLVGEKKPMDKALFQWE